MPAATAAARALAGLLLLAGGRAGPAWQVLLPPRSPRSHQKPSSNRPRPLHAPAATRHTPQDLSFHLERQTGRLSRVLERGARSISLLYRALIFTFLPTLVELCFVCSLLANAFSPAVAGLVGATFVFYVAWTLTLTQMTAEARARARGG